MLLERGRVEEGGGLARVGDLSLENSLDILNSSLNPFKRPFAFGTEEIQNAQE